MILKNLWERKIFFETLKITLFFLFVFFAVFMFVDFSIHSAKIFSHANAKFIDILNFYKNLFFTELNILLPLTILLASIKVLSEMNIHHELTALRMSGISSKLLSRPFLLIAIISTCISYANLEFFLPSALTFKNNFKSLYIKKTKYKNLQPNIIYLTDDKKLIYQKCDFNKNELFDVFFINSNTEIWHAKYLDLNKKPPVGKYVDKLSKNNSFFEKKDSFEIFLFHDIIINKTSYNLFVPHLNRSISTLFTQYINPSIAQKETQEISSYLNYKLAIPLISILLILFIFPYLLKFSKNISIFFICGFSIFGYVLFYTIMDSALILAENSNLPPYLIIWSPILTAFFIGTKKYLKVF